VVDSEAKGSLVWPVVKNLNTSAFSSLLQAGPSVHSAKPSTKFSLPPSHPASSSYCLEMGVAPNPLPVELSTVCKAFP
jgi:hypothetical protein